MKQSSSQGKVRAQPFMYFSINLHKTSLQDELFRIPIYRSQLVLPSSQTHLLTTKPAFSKLV